MSRSILALLCLLGLALPASAVVTVSFPHLESLTEDPVLGQNLGLFFDVDASGNVSMRAELIDSDSSVLTAPTDVRALLDNWEGPVGSVTDPGVRGETFLLSFTAGSSSVYYSSTDAGHLGLERQISVAGEDPGRIDEQGGEILVLAVKDTGPTAFFQMLSFSFADATPDAFFEINSNVSEEDGFEDVDDTVYELSATGASSGTVDISAEQFIMVHFEEDDFLDNIRIETPESSPVSEGAGLSGFTFDLYPLLSVDLNMDGVVDGIDIGLFIAGWKTDTTGFSYEQQLLAGDINLDGITDHSDWYLLRQYFAAEGASVPAPIYPTPEPCAALLALTGIGFAGAARRRR